MKIEKPINNSLLYGEIPASQKTGMRCDCGFSDMQIVGMTSSGYPKYKCPDCKSRTDNDPKNGDDPLFDGTTRLWQRSLQWKQQGSVKCLLTIFQTHLAAALRSFYMPSAGRASRKDHAPLSHEQESDA